jgi:cell division protein FtsB
MENKIKQVLGEYAFVVLQLQAQVEALQKEIEDLKKEEAPTKKTKNV